MNLDLLTVTLMTMVVGVVTSTVFLLGMVLRRDGGAGRLWGLGFLAGLLTVIAYLAWAASPDVWWSVAIGNGAFICVTGFMWLGARRFNGRRMLVPSILLLAVVIAELFIVILAGPEGGDWVGSDLMFFGIIVTAGFGAAECLRGEMGRHRESWGLAFVLAVQAVFYLFRTIGLIALGPDDAIFEEWFGTIRTSFFTITLSIVGVVVTSVLLSGRQRLRRSVGATTLELSDEGVLPERSFTRLLLDVSSRAEYRGDLVGVVSVRIDDLPSISTAFGSEAADAVLASFREGVRRYAPASALIGEDGPNGMLVAIQPPSAEDGRRIARRIRRGLFEELSGVVGAVIPIVGASAVLSDVAGYEPGSLIRAAQEASHMVAARIATTDVFAEQ